MSKLERRLARLEAVVVGVKAELPVFLITFVSPNQTEPPVAEATVNGCVWHRAMGEIEDAFLARVKVEARPLRPGCGMVGFATSNVRSSRPRTR